MMGQWVFSLAFLPHGERISPLLDFFVMHPIQMGKVAPSGDWGWLGGSIPGFPDTMANARA